MKRISEWASGKVIQWLTKEFAPERNDLCDIERLCYEIRPGDVILVEGHSRVSEVIKLVSQSPWTHSMLYIGRLYDFDDPDMRECIRYFYDGDPNEQLVIEALLGQGTIVSPITHYADDHLRICRPRGLSPPDAREVIAYATKQLGSAYDVRQLVDLTRFLFPWSILPRRWRSTLLERRAGKLTRTVCSTLIAEAFSHVRYPVLPFVHRDAAGDVRLLNRNPRFFSPRDFDYSPYFEIIKYPYVGVDDFAAYRKLPWVEEEVIYDHEVADAVEQAQASAVAEPITRDGPAVDST
jgi:hypothetical protein